VKAQSPEKKLPDNSGSFLTGKMKTTIKKLKPYENNLKKNPETLRSGVKL